MASCHLFALCIAIFESGFLFGMHCGRISRELCDCVSNKILLLCYVVKIEYNFPQRWITSKNDCKSCTKIGCLAANWQLSVTDITIHEQTQYIESIAWNRFESVQIIDRFSVQIDFLRHSRSESSTILPSLTHFRKKFCFLSSWIGDYFRSTECV